jgi:hypothetical protein
MEKGMNRKLSALPSALLLCSSSLVGEGAVDKPRQTRNATLRYWQAFSEMHDPDKATAEALEKISSREVPWDNKFTGIIDENQFAIDIMQRATRLPDCDWGVDYDLGPRAPIAYLPKARVLARLNTVYGMRAEANVEMQKAIDTWLAGNRFAQHLTCGGSLIFSLVAGKMLVANLHALTHTLQKDSIRLTDVQRKQIEQSVRQMPEAGFDWGDALSYEELPLTKATVELANARDASQYFREMMGRDAPDNFTSPGPADAAAFHKVMTAAEAALRQSPDSAAPRIESLQNEVKSLHPFYRATTPSLVRINNARKEVVVARNQLLAALGSK